METSLKPIRIRNGGSRVGLSPTYNKIMNIFKKIFKKQEKPFARCLFINESLPLFHNMAMNTNKRIYVIDSLNSDKVVSACDIDSYGCYNSLMKCEKKKILSQNSNVIKIRKKKNAPYAFDEKTIDLDFEKDGYRVGDIYHFTDLGFISNLESTLKIHLVLDQYVVFEENNHYTFYSFEELERMPKEKVGGK